MHVYEGDRIENERKSFCSTQPQKNPNIYFFFRPLNKHIKEKDEMGRASGPFERKAQKSLRSEATSFRALPISQLVVDSIYYNRSSVRIAANHRNKNKYLGKASPISINQHRAVLNFLLVSLRVLFNIFVWTFQTFFSFFCGILHIFGADKTRPIWPNCAM